MARYRLVFRLHPTAPFGLPDGDQVVVPAATGRQILGPVIDTHTGQIASHGTLSEYRTPEQAINAYVSSSEHEIELTHNYLAVKSTAATPQGAINEVVPLVDRLCQGLTALHGTRFFATYLSAEDEQGVAQRGTAFSQQLYRFGVTTFDTAELADHFRTAFAWAELADAVGQKALFYFEHACLLREFSLTLPPFGPHASMTQALAFLQLFKALTCIVGEPGTDRDYQRRYRELGLEANLWDAKVRPLYTVRCDDDVAHYSQRMPEPGAFGAHYGQAAAVFSEALHAYMRSIGGDGSSLKKHPPSS